MEQGHHPDSHLAGNISAQPVSDPGCAGLRPIDGRQVFDQLLDTLVELVARRIATIIIKNEDSI